jgi:hypothetical protein
VVAGQTIGGTNRATGIVTEASSPPVPLLIGLRIPDAMQVLTSALGLGRAQITFHGPHRGRVIGQSPKPKAARWAPRVHVVLKTR